MATVADLLTRALKKAGILGVGQAASGEDVSDALADANDMLAQWNRKRWLVYHLVDVAKVSTGAQSYTVGPNGDFNVARPDRLEAAFFRQLASAGTLDVDYPLHVIQSREEYNRITLKTMGTWPSDIFYDSGYPMGTVYVWPVPAASLYEIHLTLKETLASFTATNQTINLPPEYNAALVYNLAVRLRASYQLPPDPVTIELATEALSVIRGANTQIPTLLMPRAVTGNGRAYNVYSDGN